MNTVKHGETDSRLYSIWCGMKQRCLNPKASAYDRYGGRGIGIFREWADDFVKFMDWAMVNGYDDGLTIDRIENDMGYFPGNCQFLTKSDNSKRAVRRFGEENRSSKLKSGEVWLIKRIRRSNILTQKQTGKLFRVSQSTIWQIFSGRTWGAV